jgi:hypothetical protein
MAQPHHGVSDLSVRHRKSSSNALCESNKHAKAGRWSRADSAAMKEEAAGDPPEERLAG